MKYDWVTQEGRIEERVLRNEIKNIVKRKSLILNVKKKMLSTPYSKSSISFVI